MPVSNLYIGNLPPSTTNASLRKLFEGFGPIVSVKVICDAATNESKGFGFVQFADAIYAKGAKDVMNGVDIDGQILLVKEADRNAGQKKAVAALMTPTPIASPSVVPPGALQGLATTIALPQQPQPSTNVYVSGVPQTWTDAELNAFFSQYGTVVSCIMLKEQLTGRNRGSAMVRYADVTTATAVVAGLPGQQIGGSRKPLEVRFADRDRDDKTPKRIVPAATGVANPALRPRFDPYGRPIGPPSSTLSALALPKAPAAAVQSLQLPKLQPALQQIVPFNSTAQLVPHGIGSFHLQPVAPQVAIPRRYPSNPEEGSNLHITGLESFITDLHLYQAFGGFGAIDSVRVMLDAHGQCKGWGFVRFMSAADAMTAMAAVSGLTVGSKTWIVTPKRETGAAPMS
uniref:RRM domain-containing protein n=1 Tax=Eutreptiella gymnastica TaxID=73025 RepID=A0A7S1N6N1_9EUGL|mmetsp:Transcript_128695/g.222334  ORF Transcript_128695/g.222334 Transcript_128695/m.222334 type:complete len:400 (+) Transcript_128695:195-1394(+)